MRVCPWRLCPTTRCTRRPAPGARATGERERSAAKEKRMKTKAIAAESTWDKAAIDRRQQTMSDLVVQTWPLK